MKHACDVCLTGTYRDPETDRDHKTMCGLGFNAPRIDVANDNGGVEAMEGNECSACAVAFDAWASTRTEEQIDWNGSVRRAPWRPGAALVERDWTWHHEDHGAIRMDGPICDDLAWCDAQATALGFESETAKPTGLDENGDAT